MDQMLIVGASRGIGAELARSLRGEALLWGVSREPESEGFEATRPWDAASQAFPADFLPARLEGLVYCPGTIRLQPFDKIDDQAAAARFLLSRQACWITGQVLHVDGGLGAVRRFK